MASSISCVSQLRKSSNQFANHSVAQRSVDVEHRGIVVCAAVVGIEANAAERVANAYRAVPRRIDERDILPALGVVGIPRLGDLLVARPRPRQCPAVDGLRAGVPDGDCSGETCSPVVLVDVGNVARQSRAAGLRLGKGAIGIARFSDGIRGSDNVVVEWWRGEDRCSSSWFRLHPSQCGSTATAEMRELCWSKCYRSRYIPAGALRRSTSD